MKKLAVLVLTAALTACGTTDFNDGWRTGRVEGVVTMSSVVPHLRLDCRNVPADRYVVVSYSFGGSPNLRSNIIIPSKYGQRGEALRVNISQCP